MPSNQSELILTERDGAVAVVKLNRPERDNALSTRMFGALNAALAAADADPQVKAIILTSAGKLFCAGADIDEIAGFESAADATRAEYLANEWQAFAACGKPIIAAVAGYAVGGGFELALMCDIVIAAANARFGQPEIKLGLTPGGGATQRLPRVIGKQRAMELCLTGKLINAETALNYGLVNRVVSAADLQSEALKTARAVAQYSAPVIKLIKQAINASQNEPLTAGAQTEYELFKATFDLRDKKEGVAAFRQNRRPKFEDR